MITNKKKNEKTTEIYFDETPAAVVIRTHNTALKKRLLDRKSTRLNSSH